jgi:hypothetical protein
MQRHHGVEQCANNGLERRTGMLRQDSSDHPVDFRDVPLVKSGIDSMLVPKVLIDRPDADTGYFGDSVRGYAIDSLSPQDPHDRVQDGFNRLARSLLGRPSYLTHSQT